VRKFLQAAQGIRSSPQGADLFRAGDALFDEPVLPRFRLTQVCPASHRPVVQPAQDQPDQQRVEAQRYTQTQVLSQQQDQDTDDQQGAAGHLKDKARKVIGQGGYISVHAFN